MTLVWPMPYHEQCILPYHNISKYNMHNIILLQKINSLVTHHSTNGHFICIGWLKIFQQLHNNTKSHICQCDEYLSQNISATDYLRPLSRRIWPPSPKNLELLKNRRKKFSQPKIHWDKKIRQPPNFFPADFRWQRKSQYACCKFWLLKPTHEPKLWPAEHLLKKCISRPQLPK